MKRKGKTPLVVLLSVLCALFAGFVAMFLVDAFTNTVVSASTGTGPSAAVFFSAHWDNIKLLFTRFTPAEGEPFWFFSYIAIAVAVVFVVLIVLGIVSCCKNKAKAKICYIIPMLLGLVVAIDTLANYLMYVDGILGIFTNNSDMIKWHVCTDTISFVPIWSFVAAICGLLFFVLLFVVYGLGLAYIKRNNALEENSRVAIPLGDSEPVEEKPAEPVEGEYSMASATIDETVIAEEANEPEIEIEPVEDFAPVVEPEAVEETPAEPEPAPAPAPEKPAEPAIDEAKLAALLKDIVRDIVKDEIARNNLNAPQPAPQPTSITGATFGGPLVVQYFNGCAAPAVAPAPAPVAPAPAPVAPAPEPVPEKPVEKPAEPAPVVPAEKPAEPAPEKKPIERIPFPARLLAADKELQALYSELKNELLSWGVKSRVSNNGDTFRLHTKTYAKITVAGKSLKFHFALDPKDYADTTIPVLDAGNKALYVDIPLVFKVKSGLSVKRCKQLIKDACEKDGLTQGEVLSTNWIKELKALKK